MSLDRTTSRKRPGYVHVVLRYSCSSSQTLTTLGIGSHIIPARQGQDLVRCNGDNQAMHYG